MEEEGARGEKGEDREQQGREQAILDASLVEPPGDSSSCCYLTAIT